MTYSKHFTIKAIAGIKTSTTDRVTAHAPANRNNISTLQAFCQMWSRSWGYEHPIVSTPNHQEDTRVNRSK